MRLNKLLIEILFPLFVLVLTIDPGGVFISIKEPLFVILCSVGFLRVVNTGFRIDRNISSIVLTILFISVYGICIGYLRNSNVDFEFIGAYSRALLFMFIFMFLFYVPLEKIQKVLLLSGIVLAIVTLVIFATLFVNEDLYTQIFILSQDNNQFVLLGKRTFLGIEINGVYMKSAPLMFFSYLYSLYYYDKKGKVLLRLLLLSALLVAGSRTPLLLAILITIIYLRDRKIGGKVLSTLFVLFCLFAFFVIVYKLASDTEEISNELKYANTMSYFVDIFSGVNALVGSGIGSYFWASGDNLMLSYTELSYFDILRMFGLFLGGIFIFILYYIFHLVFFSRYADTNLKRYSLGYLFYMLLAGTNPFLFCPTGTFVIALGIRLVYEVNKNKKYDKCLSCLI